MYSLPYILLINKTFAPQSARLPFTIGKSRHDYPADVVYSNNETFVQINYSEALKIDYRWFDSQGIEVSLVCEGLLA